MTKEVRRRSGTGAEHTTFTGAPAEVTVDTTDNRLVVHDGVTAGGHPVAKEGEITSATAGIASKLPKDGSEAMSGNLNLNGNNLVGVGNINGGPMGGYRNKIINGNFDIWQRATSQTSNGYGSDDRWLNANVGSTKTHSQQAFALGQTDVPGNPEFFSRTVVSSAAGAGNYVYKYQPIERVSTLAGKTATITIYAKADSAKNIAVELVQKFGTGGSPSATVTGIEVETLSLTTSFSKYTYTVDIPSISSKTLGTNGDDWLGLFFWFDAGSDNNSRTNSLGQQSGTFDIAHVSVVEGDATAEDDPSSSRHIGQELALCMRYYQRTVDNNMCMRSYNAVSGSIYYCSVQFPVEMRDIPTVAILDNSNLNMGSTAAYLNSALGFRGASVCSSTHTAGYTRFNYTADAEL